MNLSTRADLHHHPEGAALYQRLQTFQVIVVMVAVQAAVNRQVCGAGVLMMGFLSTGVNYDGRQP